MSASSTVVPVHPAGHPTGHPGPERLRADAAHLRRRARQLLALASALETGTVWRLPGLAGDDTWQSPRIALCRVTLATNLSQLARAVDGLRWRAGQLDRQAEQLEREAATVLRVAVGGPT
jgi:hypothetical protein